MKESEEKSIGEIVKLIIKIDKPKAKKPILDHNQLLNKEKGFHREPGDWFKEE